MNQKNIFLKNILTSLLCKIDAWKIIFILSLILCSDICFSGDEYPGFEIQDLTGSTINYSGTITATPINLPTTASKVISEVLYHCPFQTPQTLRCLISFDGVTYFTLAPGEFIGWSAKGFIRQIKVKGNTSGVTYEAIINYENW